MGAEYGQVNAECVPVMPGYEARLEARMKLNKCLICCDNLARVREYLVINQLLYNAKSYAKLCQVCAGWLAGVTWTRGVTVARLACAAWLYIVERSEPPRWSGGVCVGGVGCRVVWMRGVWCGGEEVCGVRYPSADSEPGKY